MGCQFVYQGFFLKQWEPHVQPIFLKKADISKVRRISPDMKMALHLICLDSARHLKKRCIRLIPIIVSLVAGTIIIPDFIILEKCARFPTAMLN